MERQLTSRALLLAAAGLLAAPVAAQAQFVQGQPVTGLYIGLGAGVNFRLAPDEHVNFNVPNAPAGNLRVNTSTGYAVLGSVGWGFGNGLRAEIEGNYRQNDTNNSALPGGVPVAGSGLIRQYGAMANLLYDFNMFRVDLFGIGITPYIGGGVGYVWNEWRRVGGRFTDSYRFYVNGTEGSFAYQAIAGLNYDLGMITPGLSATLEYRYFGAVAPELSTELRNNANAHLAVGTYKPTSENHNILLGLRYAFNTPRPAPVVAAPVLAAPAPARTYLVFFDWDRADLTDRARQIIGDAANNARAVGSTRIEVSGHADRTGTAQYNQRLSVRRAEAVAGELVRQGISRDQIGIQGFGFDRPLVPTAMGVREPQNRRVEIVLR